MNDKTIIENEAKTPAVAQSQALNPSKVAFASMGAGVLVSSGAFAAWGMTRDGEVNSEVLATDKDEKLTIERDEQGKIQAIAVDEDNDGKNDFKFDNAEKINNSDDNKDGTLDTATKVNDNMNFSEAFAAARQEVGAGGVFTWHGKLYGTYYKDEWDGMSADEKADYNQDVNQHIAHHPLPTAEVVPTAEPVQPTAEVVPTAEPVPPTAEVVQPTAEVVPTAEPVPPTAEVVPTAEPVVMGEADMNQDGVIDAQLIDTNNDQKPDVIQIDANQDGVVEAVAVDQNFDEVVDAIYVDENQDGKIDYVTDGQGNVISGNAEPVVAMDNGNDMANNDFDDNANVSEWL